MQTNASNARRSGRPPWTFQRFIVVISFVLLILALFVSGGLSPGIFLFVGPFLIPGALFTALLVWKPNPWFYLGAGIANSYVFFLFLPFIIVGLSNPASTYEYSGYALGLVALFWALPLGVIGFWRARKGQAMPDVRTGWRTRQGLYTLAVAFIAIGGIITSGLAYAHASAPTTGGGFDFQPSTTVSVTTENFAFNPSTFTVPVRTVAAIVVTNRDNAFHTFTYEVNGQTYSHDLLPGTTTKFLVFFDAPGSVAFWCIPHRSMGMIGTITVG